MKLKESYFRYPVLAIAILLFSYEAIKTQFGFSVNPNIEKTVTIILFVIAVGLYGYGRSLRNKTDSQDTNKN